MRILTIATKKEGYFDLLVQTAKKFEYDLQVLGWGKLWKGLAGKLDLYIDELEKINPREPVVCVDGYDVVVTGSSAAMQAKFLTFNRSIIFSGQRYFPNQKFIQALADKLMSNDSKKTIGYNKGLYDYSRPCMGLLIGYAGALLKLFHELIKINEKEKVGNDQILLNIYYLNNPGSIEIDYRCEMFQNLWRTKGGIYGKFSLEDKHNEIEVFSSGNETRIRNKYFHTEPCFLHAPFNLDMGSVLTALHLDAPTLNFKKGWRYWKYSILHYVKRGIKFYFKEIIVLFLLLLILTLLLIYLMK